MPKPQQQKYQSKMKRSINANVLNGFLSQAISHNKYLEESEMWKKRRELEDTANSRRSSSSKRTKPSQETAPRERSNYVSLAAPSTSSTTAKEPEKEVDDLQVMLALYRDVHQKPVERWGHSGFEELYPDHVTPHRPDHTAKKKPTDPEDTDRSNHRSLPEESPSRKSHSKHKKKHSKHKKKHKKKKY